VKVSSFFNLIVDGSDLLDFFQKVDTSEQLVSRLERLKREAPDELLSCIVGLRASIATALDDTLEMSAVLDEPDNDNTDLDSELASLEDLDPREAEENDGEMQNPSEPPPAKDSNNAVPPDK
jgi:hypothetical protein